MDEWVHAGHVTSPLAIDSSVQGVGGDNPTEASNVNDLQYSRSVVLYYEETYAFNIAMSASYIDNTNQKGGGRNFLFALQTPLDNAGCASNPDVSEYFFSDAEFENLGTGGLGDAVTTPYSRRRALSSQQLRSLAERASRYGDESSIEKVRAGRPHARTHARTHP